MDASTSPTPNIVYLIAYCLAVIFVAIWGIVRVKAQPTLQDTPTPSIVPVVCMLAAASWVGASYINVAAQSIFEDGLAWCLAPVGFALRLIIGGWLFAEKVRETRALTILDPFQQHYGPRIAALLGVAAVCAEVFWVAANVSALRDALQILGILSTHFSVFIPTWVALCYTSLGGLVSVVYADVIKLFTTFVGLWTVVLFVVNAATGAELRAQPKSWVGIVETRDLSQIVDRLLMLTLGGIPWQVYFQRVLSSDSDFHARILSYTGAIGCICVAFPSAIVGAFGKVTNFTAAGYPGPYDLLPADRKDVLPIAVRYVTPTIVQIVGSLTIAASVMSTVDSSTLSASTLVARNVYHSLIRPKARDAEVALVLRSTVWLVGGAAVTLALAVRSGAHLWAFATDLAYVLLFPQLVCLLFFPDRSNARGAASAFFVGLVLRVLCGDPGLGVPALVKLPLYDSELGQQFPYRTLCMVTSLGSLIVISRLTARAPRQDINMQPSPSLAILDNLENTKPRLDNLENNEPRLDNLENTKPRLDKLENYEPRLDNLENVKPRLDNLGNTKPRLDNLENTKPRLENMENTKPRLDNLQNTKPRLDNLENSKPRPGDGGLPSNSKARTVASSRMSPERQPATKARVPREEFFTAQCGAAPPAVVKKSELPSPTASTPFKKTPASVARRSRNPRRANGINSVSRPSDKAGKSSTPPTATSKAPSSFVSGAPSRMEVAGDPHKHSDVLDAKGEHKKERPVSDSPAKVRKTEDAGSRGGKRSRQSTAASTPNDCVTGTASAASAALAASATSQPKASKQARRTEKTKAPSEKSEVGGGIGRDRS